MTGIMIKKCSEQQKKKVNDKKVMILQRLLTTWVLSKEKSEWYYELQNSVFLLTFYHLRDEKKKKKNTLTLVQTFGIFASIVVHTSLSSTSFRLRNETRLALAKTPASATFIEPAPEVCTAELC